MTKKSEALGLIKMYEESLANGSYSSEADRLWQLRRIIELQASLPKVEPTHYYESGRFHRPNTPCKVCGKTSRNSIHF